MLILLLLSSLQVTKAGRIAKEKTKDAVWLEVSWERVCNAFANSFDRLDHVGSCCCVTPTKLQLHYVCLCAVQCTQRSHFQSLLQSVD